MTVIMIRSAILYLLVVFAVRLMGKRQLGELQPSELVITILISNIATLPLDDPDIPVLAGVTPILSLVCFEVLMSGLILRFPKLRKIVSGSPRTVIKGGSIDHQVMKELRFSLDDLLMALRSKDIFDPGQVQYAVVETNGSVSVMKKEDSGGDPPEAVISDGVIIPEALMSCGLPEASLDAVLRRLKLSPEDVFLMTADSSGNAFVVPRSGKPVNVRSGEI